MTIINFDDIIGKKFKTITNNVFCLNHPSNCLIIGVENMAFFHSFMMNKTQ